jgi:SpoU rRNA methylase family enzyme
MVEIRNILQPLNQNLVLISSDTRFLNAAEKEGFKTLNPEKNTKDEVLLLLRLP